MKDEFLVIDHNDILRILFLKYNTLLKLKEYSESKNNIKLILNENKTINNVLDNKANIEPLKNEILSPRNTDKNMVTIELKNTDDIIIDIKPSIEEIEEEEEKEANEKCINGCNFCANGCDLILTGVGFICSCFSYYVNKVYKKIKKCFN
tara:strand:+ start:620 stop:1069 length:450 start_codon:yes stop_codon:yes gene_type:complete